MTCSIWLSGRTQFEPHPRNHGKQMLDFAAADPGKPALTRGLLAPPQVSYGE
jgi:hypothetical protein